MRYRGLSTAQRVVLVIGLGFSLYRAGQWLIEYLEFGSRAFYGWTGYAPLQNTGPHPLSAWVVLVIWLLITLFWTVCSLAILHRRSDASASL
jgi:heme/copper-type cytochrome/quinol oxidase subunit 1